MWKEGRNDEQNRIMLKDQGREQHTAKEESDVLLKSQSLDIIRTIIF